MFDNVQSFVKKVGGQIGLTQDQLDQVLSFNKEHAFEIDLNGKKHKAYRVQHSNKLGPYKGGIRFHPEVGYDEAKALALLMSLKAALIGLPLGGAKGGVAVDSKKLSKSELEQISRAYVKHLHPHIGPSKDIPAPDVGTNSQIIDWMVDEYELQTGYKSKASFTGKSIKSGGSLGRDKATGYGGVIALSKLLELKEQTNKQLTLALEGFGNVGSYFALLAEKEASNWQIVGATDSRGGIYDQTGLSAKQLVNLKSSGKGLAEYGRGKVITNGELIGLNVDVLVLAALEDSISHKNMKNVKAKYIVELANGPISDEANEYLAQQGVVILPDILANAGGIIVSYLEWQQNLKNEHWTEKEVDQKLKKYIEEVVNEVFVTSKQLKLNLKEAAIALALKKLVD